MKRKMIVAMMTIGILAMAGTNVAGVMAEEIEVQTEAGASVAVDGDSEEIMFAEDGTPVTKTVKASSLSYPSEDSYEYPYMGLKFSLPEALKKQMDNSDVIMISAEEWTEDMTGIQYAYFHWDKLTEEQKNEDVNMLGTGYEDFLASIERIGTLGVYNTDVVDNLDSITGCTEHKKLGTSADGKFEYYLSTNKDAEADLTDEIEQIETNLTDMTPFSGSQSVFDQPAEGANEDAETVGTFETTDINGTTYTESVFGDYDLTLVNAFTTWCSPCVNEMPELEKLYQELKDSGVGVVGMVLDTVGEDGKTAEDVVEKAKVLQEKTGVTYPLLIPDEGMLNGRIRNLQSFPESFFVDKDGNIVSDAIMGSKDLEGWKEAVEQQLEALKEN